jgi:hypothetical protein
VHLPRCGRPDCSCQLFLIGVLEQVPDCSCPYRSHHRAVFKDARECNNLDIGQLAANELRRRNAVHFGHQQVHQYDIGPESARLAQTFSAICRFADHLEFGIQANKRP